MNPLDDSFERILGVHLPPEFTKLLRVYNGFQGFTIRLKTTGFISESWKMHVSAPHPEQESNYLVTFVRFPGRAGDPASAVRRPPVHPPGSRFVYDFQCFLHFLVFFMEIVIS